MNILFVHSLGKIIICKVFIDQTNMNFQCRYINKSFFHNYQLGIYLNCYFQKSLAREEMRVSAKKLYEDGNKDKSAYHQFHEQYYENT